MEIMDLGVGCGRWCVARRELSLGCSFVRVSAVEISIIGRVANSRSSSWKPPS